jgi:hypothetical protein
MLERFVNREVYSSYEDWKQNFRILTPDRFNMAYDVVDAGPPRCPAKKLCCGVMTLEMKSVWTGVHCLFCPRDMRPL